MDWLFAYGSLVPAGAAALSRGAAPCRLEGWRRSWGVAMDNSVDLPAYKHFLAPDGTRPRVMVAFVDIDRALGGVVNGVAVPVPEVDLPALDLRERNYARVEVTAQLDIVLEGRVWAYSGLPEARARARLGRSQARLVVARDYLDRVRTGFELIGQREAFERLTAPPLPPVAELRMVLTA